MLPVTGSQLDLLEEATQTYEMNLAFSADVSEYLTGRGIDPATASGARLGVVGDDPYPGHLARIGWLSIPYLLNGKPLTMRFRCLEEHNHADPLGDDSKLGGHGKYMSQFEDPARTYNVTAIHDAVEDPDDHSIHLCEGEMDAIILGKLGWHAIAVPGSKNWHPWHRKMLAGFNEIYVWADGDTAGQEFARKVTRSIRRATLVRMPTRTDVGELYLQRGEEGLRAVLKGER